MNEKPEITSCSRLGKSEAEATKPRPIRFTLNSDVAHQILRKAKRLRGTEEYKSVYISSDRTIEEQRARKELVTQLKQRMIDDKNNRYIIKEGHIVCVTKYSEQL